MTKQFIKVQVRLNKYYFFIGTCGCIATLFGPGHSTYLKAAIGALIGCAILGKRLPQALKESWQEFNAKDI